MDRRLDRIRKDIVDLLPRLRRFARALTANAADADDLVQDAVERALSRLHQWEDGTRLDSWMFRIAKTVWIDKVRAAKVRRAEPLSDEEASGAHDGARDAEARLTFADTVQAFGDLPEDQRVAVALIAIDGMSYRDAAEVLGVPIGTLTSRLARARIAMAEKITGEAGQGVLP
ncbi:MAG TPA: sigma-70 family RNA polymerase sigma factor [Rhizomicrobium sp.]|nr:sigma-70 family RNA polymerase sigma factor [Rhizomicrobium sp.]